MQVVSDGFDSSARSDICSWLKQEKTQSNLTCKNVFILDYVFNGLSNPNKLSSVCNRQVNCTGLPSDLLKATISLSSEEWETCSAMALFSFVLQFESESTVEHILLQIRGL